VNINGIADGTYSYTVTATNYEDFTGSITVSGTEINEHVTLKEMTATGIEELSSEHIKIYPNPVSERLVIEVPSKEDVKTIGLFNIAGQKLYEAIGCRNKVTVDLSTVPIGILVVKLTFENGNIVIQKVVHINN
jgi:hypothetical protein